MRATTVRFGDELWRLLEREAQREGVSGAQFIRDATILRIAYAMGQRGDTEFEAALRRTTEPPPGDSFAGRADRPEALLNAALTDPERLEALRSTALLDADIAPSFDRLARLAAHVLNAPVALVSLVDADRQVFKSCLGLPEPWASDRQSPLTHSFCQHAVASREPLLVDDAREHELLRTNLAIRDMGVIAYAGIPLIDPDGHALGTLCVIDSRPRHWTTHQVQLLADLAASVVTEISLARAAAGGRPEQRRAHPLVGSAPVSPG
jgi:GAF domain